ncbi:MAG: cupin domain-containing protein [Gammaproteobacteria bacterium]|nr:cupin domain-containing protein [Gammaproteobacteria bacterium]
MSTYEGLLRAADIKRAEATFSHPWNDKSEICGAQMSRLAGLSRSGVSLARLAPGKESFAYHCHHREEEWIYILKGTAVALIDGAEYQMEAGDFVGFATPSVAHNLANRSDEELVYLMGGENHEYEIADFPVHDKRMIRRGEAIEIYTLSDAKPFFEE